MPTMAALHEELTTLAPATPAGPPSAPRAPFTDCRTVPYNALPLLPPPVELETKRTLKKAIMANKALAELRTAGELIPNQGLLIRAILLQEAKLSSEIENIVTTDDDLYRAFSEDSEKADPSTKEVLRYEQALWHGYKLLREEGRPISVDLFLDIVGIIKQRPTAIRSEPGTRIVNPRRESIYAPPSGERRLRELLDNLLDYLQAQDGVDPLIKMAVAHYQFEAIHPFPDGNGRTGRVLNILHLVNQGLLDLPVLYLSRSIIQNKRLYYEGLRRVTEEHAWEDWIVYILEAVEATAVATKVKVLGIRDALTRAIEQARTDMTRGYSKELIELVFQQPYTRISFLDRAGIAKRDAASAYLRELERIGILKGVKHGRERLYINHKLQQLLAS